VVQVIDPMPETALGIWLAKEIAGVQDIDVDDVFVAIVPVAVPKQ